MYDVQKSYFLNFLYDKIVIDKMGIDNNFEPYFKKPTISFD
ncbi:hypothetical protein [Nitrosophilus labii]|nr:hypothetical protein [Nitrosophilus labii]